MWDKQLVYALGFLTVINKHIWFNAVSKELDVSYQSEEPLEMTALRLWYITFYMTICFQMCKLSIIQFYTVCSVFPAMFCSCFEFWTHVHTYQSNDLPQSFLPSVLLQCGCIDNRAIVCMKLCFLLDYYQSQIYWYLYLCFCTQMGLRIKHSP